MKPRENEISDQLIAACSSKRYRKKMQEKYELTLKQAIEIGQVMENVRQPRWKMVYQHRVTVTNHQMNKST